MMRGGRVYHAAAPSQYYAEPKRLERLGLVRSSKETGRTRERTVYRLTDAGLAALEEWINRPSPVPRLAGEPPVRIISADLTGEAAVRESLLTMRAEIAELRANTEELEQRASTIPHREKYLALNARLAKPSISPRSLSRFSTIDSRGQPDVVPVMFEFDGAEFWIGGSGESVLSTRKIRNVPAGNRRVALVVDDLASFDPFVPAATASTATPTTRSNVSASSDRVGT